MKSYTFWGVTLCSLVEFYLRFRGKYCLHLHGRRVSPASNKQAAHRALIYSSILNREAVYFSETAAKLYNTTWYHVLDDSTLYSNRRGNTKSRKLRAD
jgi:hypothetical protein